MAAGKGQQFASAQEMLAMRRAHDPELVALVTLETRELLAQYIGKPRADAVPVLRLDAADFAAAVRGLPVVPVAIDPR